MAADSAIVAMLDVLPGALLESDHEHVRSHGYANNGGPASDATISTHGHAHTHAHGHAHCAERKKNRTPLPTGSAAANKSLSGFSISEMPVSVACARCRFVLGMALHV